MARLAAVCIDATNKINVKPRQIAWHIIQTLKDPCSTLQSVALWLSTFGYTRQVPEQMLASLQSAVYDNAL